MTLSKIWSYIILFSILVACYQFIRGDKNIFNDLVTEKKLKEHEEFNEVKYSFIKKLTPENEKKFNSFSSRFKTSNWHKTLNIFDAQYLIDGSNNSEINRGELEKLIAGLNIFSLHSAATFKGSIHNATFFPIAVSNEDRILADSLAIQNNLVPVNSIFQSDYILTSISNTDSLKRSFLAKLDRQKIIPAKDMLYYLPKNIDGIFETGKFAIMLVIGLIGTLALFMGLLNIAEAAGGINVLSRVISPFLAKLFPGIPKNHASFGHMVMNFSANMLGLDNAATPFGLKAMQSMQELNPEKEKGTDAQIMFLALHASGLTLIPVSIIAVRAANGSLNPNEIFIPLMLSTFVCTLTAMLLVSFKQRINVFQSKIFFPIISIAAFFGLFIWFLKLLRPYALEQFSDSFSNGAILLVFLVVITGALYKRTNIFDAFVEGAKGGFETAVRIIPYMVGMLVAVSMLRTSGAFDLIITPVKTVIAFTGMDTQWAEGLPTALLRPFSAGGARGFMIDAMKTYGPDSFIGKLVCVLQGSSETTFYVVALYFGSVSVKNTRYSIPVMLLADLAGIIFSICICYFLWQ